MNGTLHLQGTIYKAHFHLIHTTILQVVISICVTPHHLKSPFIFITSLTIVPILYLKKLKLRIRKQLI